MLLHISRAHERVERLYEILMRSIDKVSTRERGGIEVASCDLRKDNSRLPSRDKSFENSRGTRPFAAEERNATTLSAMIHTIIDIF
jgi:hypothetical protein